MSPTLVFIKEWSPHVLGAVVTIAFALYLRASNTKRARLDLIEAEAKAEIARLLQEHENKRQEEIKALFAMMDQTRLLVAELGAKESTRTGFWDEIQRSAINAAHRPHPASAEKDALMERRLTYSLTPVERVRLEAILQAEIDDPEVPIALALKIISAAEKIRIMASVNDARMLLAIMPKADQEHQQEKLAGHRGES